VTFSDFTELKGFSLPACWSVESEIVVTTFSRGGFLVGEEIEKDFTVVVFLGGSVPKAVSF